MKRLFHLLKNDRTIKSTTLMVGGQGAANVGAYLYHLFLARLLVPAEFGLLQSLISFSNILTVPLVTLNTVVAKFVSSYVGKGELKKIASFYFQLRKYLFVSLVLGGILFFVFTEPITRFLHLDSWVNVLFLDLALFFGLLTTLNRATLRGLSLFLHLTIAQFIESYGKLVLGVIAVFLGLGVTGAFGAFVFVIFLSFLYMERIINKKLKVSSKFPLPLRAMGTYAVPSAIMTVSVISLYNTDVILVRHFLSGHEAGLYAALSVLGKIIFFGTSRVTMTMFPLVSEAHARGAAFHRIFLLSLVYLLVMAAGITLFYALFPTFAIRVLIGPQYLEAHPLLASFSVFLSLCAIINLLVNFFLSIHRTRTVYVVLVGAIIQTIAIFFFHANLAEVINISLIVTTAIATILLLYYLSILISKPLRVL